MLGKKFISIIAFIALILVQFSIAQHSATHIDHEISFAVEQADNHDLDVDHSEDNGEKHECPECLLTKSLQSAFYNTAAIISVSEFIEHTSLQTQAIAITQANSKANAARAPPTLLI